MLDKAAQAGEALQQAAELAEEAQHHLVSAVEGSLQGDAEATNAQFAAVVSGAKGLHQFLGAGISGVEKILHSLELSGTTSATPAGPEPAAQPHPKPASAPPPRGSPDHIEQLRRDLPPPVEPRSGQKTHGRWFTNTDVPEAPIRRLTSGVDEMSKAVEQHLTDMGIPALPVTSKDVEIKIAVYMAQKGITDATVTINHVPCKGDFGCDPLVPIVLPEGSSLTVYGINRQGVMMKKTYTGGAKPSWS
ncbi:DddA-like double-stranded DNA deaminase toxin [Lentzea sp. E54]|uniref:DddA-like double-stranded DNA deaminase toxin n=1 Tax=Lentzea xerophila TaxID=3435883 RepID=UPI003DA236B4